MPADRLQRRARVTPSFLILLLLVVATVTWRPKVYYSGGADTVVIFKALLTAAALVMAWVARRRCTRPWPMGTRSVWLLVVYVAASTFGGWAADQFLPSAVLSVRLLGVGAVIVLLVRTYRPQVLLSDLLKAMLLVGLAGAATGLPNLIAGSRLRGTVLPLNANEIAMLCGLPAIALCYLIFSRRASLSHMALLLLLLVVIWATGSRTGLLALVLGFTAMLVQARRLKPGVAFALACMPPLLLSVAAGTPLLASFFARGGTQNLATLNARTIAWSAALGFPDSEWVRWLGSGLVQKKIPVEGQYWNVQGLDSSWVSALVQGGLVGVAVLGVWIITTLVSSSRCRAEQRMLFLGLAIYLSVRSVLESGLLDSTPTFMTLLLLSLLADKATRTHHVTPSWLVPAATPTQTATALGP